MSATETQPERTALSWQRTGLGLLGIAALLGHTAVRRGGVLPAVAAAAVTVAGLAVLAVLAPRRARALTRAPGRAPVPAALVTAAVVGAALAAAATVLSR